MTERRGTGEQIERRDIGGDTLKRKRDRYRREHIERKRQRPQRERGRNRGGRTEEKRQRGDT